MPPLSRLTLKDNVVYVAHLGAPMLGYNFFRDNARAVLHHPISALLAMCGIGLIVAAVLTLLNVQFGWDLKFKSGATFIELPREMGGALFLGLAGLLFLGLAWCLTNARLIWSHKWRALLVLALLVLLGWGLFLLIDTLYG